MTVIVPVIDNGNDNIVHRMKKKSSGNQKSNVLLLPEDLSESQILSILKSPVRKVIGCSVVFTAWLGIQPEADFSLCFLEEL